jgi:predicted RNA-binding Zn-ribbon protein involved in translation (DUF1610 family)
MNDYVTQKQALEMWGMSRQAAYKNGLIRIVPRQLVGRQYLIAYTDAQLIAKWVQVYRTLSKQGVWRHRSITPTYEELQMLTDGKFYTECPACGETAITNENGGVIVCPICGFSLTAAGVEMPQDS